MLEQSNSSQVGGQSCRENWENGSEDRQYGEEDGRYVAKNRWDQKRVQRIIWKVI